MFYAFKLKLEREANVFDCKNSVRPKKVGDIRSNH